MRTILNYIAGITALLLLGCGDTSSGTNADSVRDTTGQDSVTVRDTVVHEVVYARDSFLLDSFMVLVDSFFTAYAGGELAIQVTEQKYTKRDTLTSVRYILKPVNGSMIRQLNFDAGAGNPTLTFCVYEALYNSEADANSGWKEFRRLSGMPSNESDDRFPCVTYCNDHAFLTGNKIFWLNADCGYGEKMFAAMAGLLQRCIYSCKPMDTITCERGDGLPEVH